MSVPRGHEPVPPVGQLGAEGVGDRLDRPAAAASCPARRRGSSSRETWGTTPSSTGVCASRYSSASGAVSTNTSSRAGSGSSAHGQVPDVGQRLLAAVLQSRLGHVGVAGDPHDPAGHGRRPADHVRLFQDQDRRAPPSAASVAAVSAAPPEPTTITSATSSHVSGISTSMFLPRCCGGLISTGRARRSPIGRTTGLGMVS